MSKCPMCNEPHSLSQCKRWRVPLAALLFAPLLAAAEPFATATSADGAIITLHNEAGPACVIAGATVMVSWLDGDRDNIPVSRLRRTAGG